MAFQYNAQTPGVYAAVGGSFYYLPSSSAASLPTAEISASDAWYSYAGYFLFLNGFGGTKADTTPLTAFLEAHFPAFQDERHILWIDCSGNTPACIGQITFRASQWNNFGTITKTSNLGIGQYTMPIEPGMMVYPTANGSLLEAASFGTATHFSFLHPEAQSPSDFTQHIAFGGGTSGMITATGMITDFSNDPASGWDVGFRYFMQDGEELVSQFFPIFNPSESSTETIYSMFNMQWDLFNPLQETNTFLQFTGQRYTMKLVGDINQLFPTTDNAMLSFFRTRTGEVVTLTPDSTALPKLVFQSKSNTSNAQDYYLVPSGQFSMGIEGGGTSGTYDLLCGFVGTEYIRFNTGDFLNFIPNYSAIAPAFPASSLSNGSDAPLPLPVTVNTSPYDAPATAWVQLVAAGGNNPQYYSQPESSPLYQQTYASGTPTSDSDLSIFAYQANLETPILNLGATTPDAPPLCLNAFPVATFSGLDSANTIPFLSNQGGPTPADLESQVVNPVRKHQLSTSAGPSAGTSPVTTITPQGVLVTVDTDTSLWTQALLATNSIPVSGGGSTTYNLAFHNLSPALTNAFQSNQQFMVISSATNLGQMVNQGGTPTDATKPWFSNEMSIEGWPFVFNMNNPGPSGSFSNVMIVKFCNGNLIDLLQAPQTWTQGAALNDESSELGGLSAWMVNYVKNGIKAYNEGDEDFEQFAQIVQDNEWQGILGLNVDISEDGFPAQLEGLLAGIDESQFKAHHMGVQVNQPLLNTSSALSLGADSKLFGLINYSKAALTDHSDPSADFDFRVTLLKVVFKNSKITNFKGEIQLLVNKLLGTPVKSTTSKRTASAPATTTSNSLFFKSGFEVHDGIPTYTFTDLEDTRFYMANNVLNYMEITKATFNTMVPKSVAGVAQTEVHSRFTMWGYMGFSTQSPASTGGLTADLLSFGEVSGSTASRTGLSFSNLLVDMSFPVATPHQVSYTTTSDNLEFDKALSTARAGSFCEQLPVNVTSFVSGKKGETVSQMGFVPMGLFVSGPEWEEPSGEWKGLVMDINLGSLGALGAKVTFTAKLILAWAVESRPDSYAVMAGIAMPGVNAKGLLFDLEGILKLSMDGIQLIGAENTTTNSMGYMIKISDIALKFLGIKLPPGATTEFFIFGDPSTANRTDKIGWYGAFTQNS